MISDYNTPIIIKQDMGYNEFLPTLSRVIVIIIIIIIFTYRKG